MAVSFNQSNLLINQSKLINQTECLQSVCLIWWLMHIDSEVIREKKLWENMYRILKILYKPELSQMKSTKESFWHKDDFSCSWLQEYSWCSFYDLLLNNDNYNFMIYTKKLYQRQMILSYFVIWRRQFYHLFNSVEKNL